MVRVFTRRCGPRMFRLGMTCLLCAIPHICALTHTTEAGEFAQGKDFTAAIHSRGGLSWSKNPIGSGLGNLARAKNVAIFLDRRVPPMTLMEFQSDSAPLWALLDGLANSKSWEWSIIHDVVYLGPAGSGARLESLSDLHRQQISTIPPPGRQALLKSGKLQWPRLAQPRDLLRQLAGEAGVTVSNLEAIPHDLWPAVDLPAMPWLDRCTLVLNNFDLMLRLGPDGRTAQLIRVTQQASFQRLHHLPAGTRFRVSDLPAPLANVSIKRERGGIRVQGSFADHDSVSKWILRRSGPTRPATGVGPEPNKVYDLRIDNQPVGGVIKALAGKLGWTPQVSAAASKRLGQRISFQVQGATAEQLIAAAVKPAGLAHRLKGNVLEIFAADELQ